MRFPFRKGGDADHERAQPPEARASSAGDARKDAAGEASATRTDALRMGIHLPETEDDLREDASGARRR